MCMCIHTKAVQNMCIHIKTYKMYVYTYLSKNALRLANPQKPINSIKNTAKYVYMYTHKTAQNVCIHIFKQKKSLLIIN